MPEFTESLIAHNQALLNSYRSHLGIELIDRSGSLLEQSQRLWHAPIVVLSHDGQADPIFTYGNQLALDLWEFDWESFIQLPSRLSAEPDAQADRDRLLAEAKAQGYIQNYQGIRRSRSGVRFWIENVTLWSFPNHASQKDASQTIAQAATFSNWRVIP